jgi:hypothetical protein
MEIGVLSFQVWASSASAIRLSRGLSEIEAHFYYPKSNLIPCANGNESV